MARSHRLAYGRSRACHWVESNRRGRMRESRTPRIRTFVMAILDAAHIYAISSVLTASTGAVFDICSRRIPNALTASAIVAGLAAHALLDGLPGLATSLEAGLICGLVF